MKGFIGVHASPGGFTASNHHNGEKYHLGVFNTPERAHVVVKLFKHWLQSGFTPGQIPRLWTPDAAPEPCYEPLANYKINGVVKGTVTLTPDDIKNLVTELQSLRVSKYGPAKAARF